MVAARPAHEYSNCLLHSGPFVHTFALGVCRVAIRLLHSWAVTNDFVAWAVSLTNIIFITITNTHTFIASSISNLRQGSMQVMKFT